MTPERFRELLAIVHHQGPTNALDHLEVMTHEEVQKAAAAITDGEDDPEAINHSVLFLQSLARYLGKHETELTEDDAVEWAPNYILECLCRSLRYRQILSKQEGPLTYGVDRSHRLSELGEDVAKVLVGLRQRLT